MKKDSLFTGITFLVLSGAFSVFLNLFFSKRYFAVSASFWNVALMLYFELAVILLGSGWVLFSAVLAKFFNLKLAEVLKRDLLTYYPLLLLLLYGTNLRAYTHNKITPPILLGAILLLIMVFKAALLLRIKNKSGSAFLLVGAGIMLPLILTNYFVLGILLLQPSRTMPAHESSKTFLLEKLKNQYNADPLSLFKHELKGVHKKKIKIKNEFRNTLVLLPPGRVASAGTSVRPVIRRVWSNLGSGSAAKF